MHNELTMGDMIMISDNEYINFLNSLAGKTIAIVYIFRGENALGFQHYEVWQSDVISSWITAVEEIKCLPLIIDVRTFISKAVNNSLPKIDFVINLSNGTTDLSNLGLVPSVCSFLNIPCIPCNTNSIILGENKKVSNIIASYINLNVPRNLKITDPNGIIRPVCYGSSKFVKKNPSSPINVDYIYQEFIPGYDFTTPLLFNPITETLDVMPSILYYPDTQDIGWYLGEAEKSSHFGYTKISISLDNKTKEKYISLAKSLGIDTFCRIDARFKQEHIDTIDNLRKKQIPYDDVFFVEINPMPTIKNDINFHTSLKALKNNEKMFHCLTIYKDVYPNYSLTGFVLSCSIYSYIKAKR